MGWKIPDVHTRCRFLTSRWIATDRTASFLAPQFYTTHYTKPPRRTAPPHTVTDNAVCTSLVETDMWCDSGIIEDYHSAHYPNNYQTLEACARHCAETPGCSFILFGGDNREEFNSRIYGPIKRCSLVAACGSPREYGHGGTVNQYNVTTCPSDFVIHAIHCALHCAAPRRTAPHRVPHRTPHRTPYRIASRGRDRVGGRPRILSCDERDLHKQWQAHYHNRRGMRRGFGVVQKRWGTEWRSKKRHFLGRSRQTQSTERLYFTRDIHVV